MKTALMGGGERDQDNGHVDPARAADAAGFVVGVALTGIGSATLAGGETAQRTIQEPSLKIICAESSGFKEDNNTAQAGNSANSKTAAIATGAVLTVTGIGLMVWKAHSLLIQRANIESVKIDQDQARAELRRINHKIEAVAVFISALDPTSPIVKIDQARAEWQEAGEALRKFNTDYPECQDDSFSLGLKIESLNRALVVIDDMAAVVRRPLSPS